MNQNSNIKVSLRKFDKNDAAFIVSRLDWLAKNEEEAKAVIQEFDTDSKQNAYCILCDGMPSGYIALNEKEGGDVRFGIFIIEEMRGKGVATKAYPLIEGIVYKKGYRIVTSNCAQSNVASKKMHEKLGFVCVKAELSPKGTPVYRWRKELE